MKTKINISGVEFIMNAICKGSVYNVWGDKMNHYKFIVSISRNGEKTRFTFYGSFNDWHNGKEELNAED